VGNVTILETMSCFLGIASRVKTRSSVVKIPPRFVFSLMMKVSNPYLQNFAMLWQDARSYQILFLSSFLLLGVGWKDWTLHLDVVVSAITACLIMQRIAIAYTEQSWPLSAEWTFWHPSLRSALITGLSLSLLLRTDHWWVMGLAATAAILSKFFIQVDGKHLFNPANFGIIAAISLTHQAWVSPGQWGELGWWALLFLGAGGIVLQRVGRWDTSLVFLSTYAGLWLMRNIWLGWSWDVLQHRLMNGALLLFALFMITDPRSIPDHRWGRILWAMGVSGLTFWLQTAYFSQSALFWSLFCLSPMTVFLDKILRSQRFSWLSLPST
jgi:Na+-transporting NADH:ubiquinone oxidoreductase subunit NqrB